MKRFLFSLIVIGVIGTTGMPFGAHAQTPAGDATFPSKPIRIVVPFLPGGTPDIQMRLMMDKLAQRFGQPVVVENRAGANGIIGMEVVARAPADGHTVFYTTVGTWTVHPHLYKLPYDVLKDFTPIIHVAVTPGVLAVHPSLPVKTVKELVAMARERPGQISYGSAGVGGWFHIASELFASMTDVKFLHVPYKGASAALTDLMGGHVHWMVNTTIAIAPHVKSGKVRALATTDTRRVAMMPHLPTMDEAGVRGYEGNTWCAMGGPARTPRAAVERLNRDVMAVLQMPDIQQRLAEGGSIVTGGTPEQLTDIVKADLAKFGKLVKTVGIKG